MGREPLSIKDASVNRWLRVGKQFELIAGDLLSRSDRD